MAICPLNGIVLRMGLLLLATTFCVVPLSPSDAFPWKCYGCRGGVELLRLMYERNATADKILSVADFVCRHFADTDSFVCNGITAQFRDEFLYVLGRLALSPGQLCALLVANCGTPADPFNTNWLVPLPPKSTKNVRPSSVDAAAKRTNLFPPARPLRILQLSDLHFDSQYTPGAEADCAEPVCCLNRSSAHQGQSSSATIRKPAGKWGTLANCDIPLQTVQNMLEHIERTQQQTSIRAFCHLFLQNVDRLQHERAKELEPDHFAKVVSCFELVLLLPVHHNLLGRMVQSYSRAGHLSQLDTLTALLRRHFVRVPVFWTLGNHEGVPVNAFAPHFVPERFRPQWMYRAMLRAIERTAAPLPKTAERSAIYRGSYMLPIWPGIRLIALNNGYCDKTNMFIYLNQTDPDGSLTWLVDQLWTVEKANESVYILAHMPPGDKECLESWSRNYYRIINRFADTIAAQFFGHTHADSFRLFYEDMNNASSRVLSMLYIAPSVTTYVGVNPAYRVYVANPNDGLILDVENYFLNLSAIVDDQQQPEWQLLYTAKTEYGLDSLNAEAWNALAQRIEREPEMAQKFNRNYARRADAACDARCVAERVCAIRAAHNNATALCQRRRRPLSGGDVGKKGVKVPSSPPGLLRAVWEWMTNALKGTQNDGADNLSTTN
uniref:Sphingomyelin phosphodiesterase n=1 Tax=Globodera pallida TaxID=36090 RepID=A0A183CGW4_GLOPA